jgi:hypothetical protein
MVEEKESSAFWSHVNLWFPYKDIAKGAVILWDLTVEKWNGAFKKDDINSNMGPD